MNDVVEDTPPAAQAEDALERAVEATLFASDEPLTIEALAGHLGDAPVPQVRAAVQALAAHYEGRGIALVERGKRWHFETAADLAHLLRREREQVRRLSRAATEVLAIIAYHEPVSRAEIESIRGVQTAKGTLDVLMEAGWIKIAGRREVPGRPVIYASTSQFLDHFGLTSRRDLPGMEELRATGLLDPVDDAYDALMAPDDNASDGEMVREDEGSADGGASDAEEKRDGEAAGDNEEPLE